jgi:hypothetical protein
MIENRFVRAEITLAVNSARPKSTGAPKEPSRTRMCQPVCIKGWRGTPPAGHCIDPALKEEHTSSTPPPMPLASFQFILQTQIFAKLSLRIWAILYIGKSLSCVIGQRRGQIRINVPKAEKCRWKNAMLALDSEVNDDYHHYRHEVLRLRLLGQEKLPLCYAHVIISWQPNRRSSLLAIKKLLFKRGISF